MAKVICVDCGWIGDVEKLERVQEPRGEFWGVPCSETVYHCPVCNSDAIDDYKEEDEDDMA